MPPPGLQNSPPASFSPEGTYTGSQDEVLGQQRSITAESRTGDPTVLYADQHFFLLMFSISVDQRESAAALSLRSELQLRSFLLLFLFLISVNQRLICLYVRQDPAYP